MEERQQHVQSTSNWSESVEDLIAAGDNAAAISLLESVISDLQADGNSSDRRLAAAINDLAGIYSSQGFTLKADCLRSSASLILHRIGDLKEEKSGDVLVRDESFSNGNFEKSTGSKSLISSDNDNPEDDWEAIADRSADELLSSQSSAGISKLSLEDCKPKTRRGRGKFSYKKQELYSDHLSDNSVSDSIEEEGVSDDLETNTGKRHSTYGTRHVLLLADFPPSTKTIDLEKHFQSFCDRGVAIRWIDDTTALAVFATPSTALQAKNCVTCPFKVRILDEDDEILSSIPPKDLEPPRQRPKTSSRAAQRMIAQSMGIRPPSISFGSRELRKQEDDRRNRIVSRQKLKDDAWGDDE